jgi:hypothetical protein
VKRRRPVSKSGGIFDVKFCLIGKIISLMRSATGQRGNSRASDGRCDCDSSRGRGAFDDGFESDYRDLPRREVTGPPAGRTRPSTRRREQEQIRKAQPIAVPPDDPWSWRSRAENTQVVEPRRAGKGGRYDETDRTTGGRGGGADAQGGSWFGGRVQPPVPPVRPPRARRAPVSGGIVVNLIGCHISLSPIYVARLRIPDSM